MDLLRAYFVLPLAKTAEGIDLRGCDLSERKISRSKLNRKKRGRQKMSSSFFRRVFVTVARSNLWLGLCPNKYKHAMTARLLSVANSNISRLRDAQAFHAAVKRRRISCLRDSADISPPGAACPACPRPWLILLRICKITSIAATQSERGTEKDRRVKFIVQIKVFISASLFDIQCFMQYNIYDA